MRCLTSNPDKYHPAISMYFDDVGFFFANAWAGELTAIAEFNEGTSYARSIMIAVYPATALSRSRLVLENVRLPYFRSRPAKNPRLRQELNIGSHVDFMASRFLFLSNKS